MNQIIHKRHYALLIATLAYLLILHISHLPMWVTLLSIGFASWRLLVAFDKAPPAKLMVLAPLTLAIGIGILITYKGLIYRDSGVSLLFIMVMLKLLEAKTKHDYLLVTILGYLLTGATFLFSQSIITFLLSIPAVLMLTTALIQLHRNPQQHIETESMSVAGKMLLQSVPLMLVLFVLFPRISHPLWGGQVSAKLLNTTGLSESIELNQISQAVKNGSVAFRVKFHGTIPEQSELYWRGPVLWHVKNQRWEIASNYARLPYEPLSVAGPSTKYSITMEPNHHNWLLLLDMPRKLPDDAQFSPDRTVIADKPTIARFRYEATSWTNYRLGPKKLSRRERKMALQLTEDNPETIALGRSWTSLSVSETIDAALNLYRTKGFIYTLNPPKPGEHALDDFLFSSKRGFCEHYATSFVYLMRAAGVPARLVTGYQGGEVNEDYLIVRQSNAHAWAEVWLGNAGWVRIDPTHAVAPDRVEQDLTSAIQSNANNTAQDSQENDTDIQEQETAQLPIQERIKRYPMLHKGLLQWDSLENGWNQWVIDYNEKKQKTVLSNITGKVINLEAIAILLIGAVLLIGLGMAALFLLQNQSKQNPTDKLYARFLKKLKPFRLQPYPCETATAFAKRVADYFPHHKADLEKIAQYYNQLSYSRYSKISDSSLYTAFSNIIKDFKPSHVR